MDGESASGTPYSKEHVLIIRFAPPKEGGDGLPKIALVKEFTDSAGTVKFFTEERKVKSAASVNGNNPWQPGA